LDATTLNQKTTPRIELGDPGPRTPCDDRIDQRAEDDDWKEEELEIQVEAN
jgi:hypothetical protein